MYTKKINTELWGLQKNKSLNKALLVCPLIMLFVIVLKGCTVEGSLFWGPEHTQHLLGSRTGIHRWLLICEPLGAHGIPREYKCRPRRAAIFARLWGPGQGIAVLFNGNRSGSSTIFKRGKEIGSSQLWKNFKNSCAKRSSALLIYARAEMSSREPDLWLWGMN